LSFRCATVAHNPGKIRIRFACGLNLIRLTGKFLATALVAVLLTFAAAAQTVPQFSVPHIKDGKVTGPGFEVTLPPGVIAEPAATTECEHGFYLELPPRPADSAARAHAPIGYRYIAFDTRWDIGDMPSLDDVVNSITSNLLDNIPADLVNAGEVTVDGNFPARLGTLPARRLIIKYKNTQRQRAIRQIVVAYRTRKDASAIIYLLVLNTTEQSFQEDVGVFGKIMAGFKVTE
jgi:hypothetical protein